MKIFITILIIIVLNINFTFAGEIAQDEFLIIDTHADNTPQSVTTDTKTLTRYLIQKANTSKQKARVIYRWIVKNIKYHLAGYLREETRSNDPEVVLKKRMGVCAGYAMLFKAMAKEAGLNVEVITGVAKMPMNFKLNAPETEGHAWNAVEINGKWHLLDATGGGGSHWNNSLKPYEKIMIDHYFLIAPEKLIHSHFPKDSKWQLLDNPISKEDFLKLPQILFGYYSHNIELISPTYDVREANGNLAIKFKVPNDLVMYGFLLKGSTRLNRDATVNLNSIVNYNQVFVQKEGSIYIANVSFPTKEIYYLVIVARKKTEPLTFMQPVVLYKIKANNLSSLVYPIPTPSYYEDDITLISPIRSNFPSNQKITFKLKSDTATGFMIYGAGKYVYLKKNGNIFEGDFTIPKGDFYILGSFPNSGSNKPLLVFKGL